MKFQFLFWVLISFFCYLPITSFSLTLHLYDEVGVNEQNVYLYKIGDLILDKTDPTYLDLSQMILMNIPKKSIELSAKEIFKTIQKKYRIKLNIVGKSIKIYPLYTIVLEQEVVEKIKKEFYIKYPELLKYNIDIVFLQKIVFPKILAGDIDYKIVIPGGKLDIIKYIRIIITQDKKDVINIAFPARVLFKIPVWKTKKNLQKGTVLSEKNITYVEGNSFTIPKEGFLSSNEVIGRKINQKLSAGYTLKRENLL